MSQKPLSPCVPTAVLLSLGFLSPKLLAVQALALTFPAKGILKDKEKAGKVWGIGGRQ